MNPERTISILYAPSKSTTLSFSPYLTSLAEEPALCRFFNHWKACGLGRPPHIVSGPRIDRDTIFNLAQAENLEVLGVQPCSFFDVLLAIAERHPAISIEWVPLSLVLGPKDLTTRLREHHQRSGNRYSRYVRSPAGSSPEIFDSSLLRELAPFVPTRWREDTGAFIRTLLANSEQECLGIDLPCVPLDCPATFVTTPATLPERVCLVSPEDFNIANEVWATVEEDRTGRWAEWKRAVVRRRTGIIGSRRCRDSFVDSNVPRPTRILYVSNNSPYSGAEEVFVNLARGLSGSEQYEQAALIGLVGLLADKLQHAGVKVQVSTEDLTSPNIENEQRIVELFQQLKPDLLHFNGIVGYPVLSIASLMGIPIVQHVHVAVLDGYSQQLSRANRIICVSDFVAGQVRALDIDPQRIEVIRNGVDTDRFRYQPCADRDARRTFGIPIDAFCVLMIGRYSPDKRHEVAVRAFAQAKIDIPRLHGVFVGEPISDADGYRRIQALVDECGLRANLTFIDFQNPIELVEQACDALIMPSEGDPFPVCVLEAMALGLPVVAARSGGIVEMLDAETGILIDPGDHLAMARALVRLASDASLPTQLTLAARRRIDDELNLRTFIARVGGVFRDALSERP